VTGHRAAAEPRASIVIVASIAGSLLDQCLRRLASHETSVPFETIVVLNGAPPDQVSGLDGAQIVRSDVNLGLAGALNLARASARGEFLVSVHDGSEVQPGWLDALVETADREPGAGAVGSLVLDEARQVTSAGWMLLADGRTRAPWDGEPPPAASFKGVRPADYSPSCSLLVRTSTWDELGGADERLFPLYYVDVDLCLAIRARGQRVLVDPRSVVIHPGGSSSHQDFAGFVAERNRQLMLAKWGDLITLHEPGSARTFEAVEPPAQEWQSDPGMRERAQIGRGAEVSAAYGADLRSRLAARENDLRESWRTADELRVQADELRAQIDELRAQTDGLRTQDDAARVQADAFRAESDELRRKLALIEQGRWWRLHERLVRVLSRL